MKHLTSCPDCSKWLESARLRLAAWESECVGNTGIGKLARQRADDATVVDRRDRRRLFLKGSVAAAVMAAVGSSVWAWKWGPGGTATKNSHLTAGEILESRLLQIDGDFEKYGNSGLMAIVADGTMDDIQKLFQWIDSRRIASTYGVLVASLADRRSTVRFEAAATMGLLPPGEMRGFAGALRAAENVETDPELHAILGQVALQTEKP